MGAAAPAAEPPLNLDLRRPKLATEQRSNQPATRSAIPGASKRRSPALARQPSANTGPCRSDRRLRTARPASRCARASRHRGQETRNARIARKATPTAPPLSSTRTVLATARMLQAPEPQRRRRRSRCLTHLNALRVATLSVRLTANSSDRESLPPGYLIHPAWSAPASRAAIWARGEGRRTHLPH